MFNFFENPLRIEHFKNPDEYFNHIFVEDFFIISLIDFAANQSLLGKTAEAKEKIQTEVDCCLKTVATKIPVSWSQQKTIKKQTLRIEKILMELFIDMKLSEKTTKKNREIQEKLIENFKIIKNIYEENKRNHHYMYEN